jgi:hypothetical protein
MSNTPETEVLRISGNVTVPKGQLENYRNSFIKFCDEYSLGCAVNIVPQDDESGMRLYVVAEVELYKQWIKDLQAVIEKHKLTEIENDKLTLSLSEELAQERERSKRGDKALELLDEMYGLRLIRLEAQSKRIQALEKRLKLKENNRWRTFIKWWKELW